MVQKEFEEGGKLWGKRVYLFGCTERKCDSQYVDSFEPCMS